MLETQPERTCRGKPSPDRAGARPATGPPKIRPSKSGKWRAAVLIGVHLLVAIHIAHWLSSGSTLTPLEPSESMEFSKRGLVNAGLIFFSLMIVSTLILGRWFCGWACHLVALQDLCRWLLKRAGITPKPLRSRLLALIPIAAFVYMFIVPIIGRLLYGDGVGVNGVHLTTEKFWATFPSWPIALLTFLVCGFAAVYFLGAKGFCTYACPYGAIFGAMDRISPARFRVTDACEGCAHCTAVCSSNVRVHEEVHKYGMVVDPGCMKCLDCVSVCPNDALYFGFGKPALLVRRDASHRRGLASAAEALLAFLFLVAFFALVEITGWLPLAASVAVSAAVGLLAVSKFEESRRPEFTIWEEALLAGFFLLAFFAFRGPLPFLFSLGLAAVAAYLTLQSLRLAYRPNVSLLRWPVKQSGRVTAKGAAFLALEVGLVALASGLGLVQYHARNARSLCARTVAIRPTWAAQIESPATLDAEQASLVDEAIRHSLFVERYGVSRDRNVEVDLAWLCLLKGDDAGVERRLSGLLREEPENASIRADTASFLRARNRLSEAIALDREAVRLDPHLYAAWLSLGLTQTLTGAFDDARRTYDEALSRFPAAPEIHHNYGLLEAETGNLPAAISRFERALALNPSLKQTRAMLARALCQSGRTKEGIGEYLAVLSATPNDVESRHLVAAAYAQLGDWGEAEKHLKRALELAPNSAATHLALSRIYAMQGDTASAERHRSRAIEIDPSLAGSKR